MLNKSIKRLFTKLRQIIFERKLSIGFFIKQIPKYFIILKNKKKFNKTVVFFHIPTTGGTSVKRFMIDQFGYYQTSRINNFIKNKQDINSSIQFKNIKLLAGHDLIKHISYFKKSNLNQQFIKFSIIRDPKRIYLSRYFYLRNFREKKILSYAWNNNIVIKYNLSFDEYLRRVELNFMDNILVRFFSLKTNDYSFEIDEPNVKYKKIDKKNILIAKENCDYIGNIIFNNSDILPHLKKLTKLNSYNNNYRFNSNKSSFDENQYLNNEYLNKITYLDYELIKKIKLYNL